MRLLLTADPELPVPPPLYGGIERIVDSLVGELRRRGHHVGLIAHHESRAAVDRLYPWPGAKSQRLNDTLANTFNLMRAVRDFRPDVLHSFSRALYLLPHLPRTLPKIMSYQRRPGERQVAWTSRLGGRTITFTGCSEHICAQGRVGGGRWHAIHNFVDTSKYHFNPSVPADAPLVFLSRIERIKGAHMAIKVAKALGRTLLIAGNHGSSGEEGHYWKSEIEPELSDKIVYVGPVNDEQKNELLGGAAAMLVPIEWEEPFGIVFAEALACGTPVISCPRGALPEIVRHGVDGFLVRDFAEACRAVTDLPSLSRLDCRRRAESSFSCEAITSKYEQLYRELTATPRSSSDA